MISIPPFSKKEIDVILSAILKSLRMSNNQELKKAAEEFVPEEMKEEFNVMVVYCTAIADENVRKRLFHSIPVEKRETFRKQIKSIVNEFMNSWIKADVALQKLKDTYNHLCPS